MPGPDPAHKRAMIKPHMARRVETVVLAVLLIISFLHLLRLVTGTQIVIGSTHLPLWTSLIGCLGPAALAGLFWWSHR